MKVIQKRFKLALVTLLASMAFTSRTVAQPVALRPDQLDQLVSRIALYPDPLLAQILTASTYADQIPEAAAWADGHRYLRGDELANAISADHLNWDPSVMALLPFPSVLNILNQDMTWTRQLGDAVLAQRPDVMDAVQRMRRRAWDYGYLRSGAYVRVTAYPGYIEILPIDPAYIYVPVYDPAVVFFRPSGHVLVSAVISFGPPRVHWPCSNAVRMDSDRIHLAQSCGAHRPRTLAESLGQPVCLRASVCAPLASADATSRTA